MVTNDSHDKVAVFLRSTHSGSGSVLVILNMYATAYPNFAVKNVPHDGIWQVLFNGDLKKYSSLYEDFGSGQTEMKVSGGTGTIQLPKYSLVILAQ